MQRFTVRAVVPPCHTEDRLLLAQLIKRGCITALSQHSMLVHRGGSRKMPRYVPTHSSSPTTRLPCRLSPAGQARGHHWCRQVGTRCGPGHLKGEGPETLSGCMLGRQPWSAATLCRHDKPVASIPLCMLPAAPCNVLPRLLLVRGPGRAFTVMWHNFLPSPNRLLPPQPWWPAAATGWRHRRCWVSGATSCNVAAAFSCSLA